MHGIKLIVGLGNPGPQYEASRHNAGFWWVDQIAGAHAVRLKAEGKFFGVSGRVQIPAGEAWLLKPSTFMNASGRSVAALANFYKIAPESILVVHDELDLPPGIAKLKKGGGHGGHNGLKDIAAQLGTADYWRLRLGIGHPGDRNAVVNYVLHTPSHEEALLIEQSMDAGIEILPLLLSGKFEEAMHRLHTKK